MPPWPTLFSSVLRTCLNDRTAYSRFAAEFLDGYRSVRDLPPSAWAFSEFLVMLGSRNEKVLSYTPASTTEILRIMRSYLDTGTYDGHLVDITSASRSRF